MGVFALLTLGGAVGRMRLALKRVGQMQPGRLGCFAEGVEQTLETDRSIGTRSTLHCPPYLDPSPTHPIRPTAHQADQQHASPGRLPSSGPLQRRW